MILDKIFSQLTMKEVGVCRSVCREWNEMAMYYFEKYLEKIVIRLDGTSKISKTLKRFEGGALGPTKFYFFEVMLGSSTLKKLLAMIGSRITSLTLRYDKPQKATTREYDEDDWQSTSTDASDLSESEGGTEIPQMPISVDLFRELLCEQCPNLKRLSLNNLPFFIKDEETLTNNKQLSIKDILIYNDYQTHCYGQKFLQNLFSVCPKLKNVELDANYDSYSQDKILLHSLFHSGRIQQLNSLRLNSISGSIFDKQLYPYLQQSIAITELTVHQLECDFIKGPTLHEFLKSLSSSLRCLDLGIHSGSAAIRIPSIMNLTQLKINLMSFDSTSISILTELRFAKQFPCLVILEMRIGPFVKVTDLFLQMQPPCLSLKELSLPIVHDSPSTISNIGKIFPNLQKLSMSAQSNTTLRQIWSSWSYLKELNLCVGTEQAQAFGLDSLLTGISEDVCQQLRVTKAFDSVSLGEVGSSIANLKHLRRFKIHRGPNLNSYRGFIKNEEKISDVSAFLAISNMKSLEMIDFGIGLDILTSKGANQICDKLGLVHSGRVVTVFTKNLQPNNDTEFDEFDELLRMQVHGL